MIVTVFDPRHADALDMSAGRYIAATTPEEALKEWTAFCNVHGRPCTDENDQLGVAVYITEHDQLLYAVDTAGHLVACSEDDVLHVSDWYYLEWIEPVRLTENGEFVVDL